MAGPYRVIPYSIDGLKRLLATESGARQELVDSKLHLRYFESYFDALGAQTIVVEREYVDRDFLEDFSAYYVRCLTPYHKTCTRLHFFSTHFTSRQLARLVEGSPTRLTLDQISGSYLGFVVVKPLPQTVVGRTCLKTYPDDGGRRFFPATRDYEPNLFGMNLTVRTLAFQEQDSVVAACATSALWSAFQGTGKVFNHSILSPVEITKAAARDFPLESRAIPNHGLTMEQMAHAIQDVGLEPLTISVYDERILTGTLYAYLCGEIPSVLGLRLFREGIPPEPPYIHIGDHAVAVTGFSLGKPTPSPIEPSGFLLEASRIDRLYVHDDQIGPFARMCIDGQTVMIQNPNGLAISLSSLSTSWEVQSQGTTCLVRAVPMVALLPLYHKVRIPFHVVHEEILHFDSIIKAAGCPCQPLCWDIRLTRLNALRWEAFRDDGLTAPARRALLTKSMPRFVWRATGRLDGITLLDILFDATDIEQASLVVHVIERAPDLSAALRAIEPPPDVRWCDHGWRVLGWFRDNAAAY